MKLSENGNSNDDELEKMKYRIDGEKTTNVQAKKFNVRKKNCVKVFCYIYS